MTTSSRLAALFCGHGSPMNALEPNRWTDAWRRWGGRLAGRMPRAVLVVSAHWFVPGTAVTAMGRPRTIHDFSGFPQALFDVTYPAPGDPALAAQVAELLAPTEVALDQTWGLDHGAWSVLVHVVPDADIPVVQLAIDRTAPAAVHWEIGARLAPLRDDGVLVVGSGNVVHNLGVLRFAATEVADWAVAFDRDIQAALDAGDRDRLVGYDRHPAAHLAVPTPEHFLPLLYVAATRQAGDDLAVLTDGFLGDSLSMRSIVVG